MSDNFTKQMKKKLGPTELPTGFDQRFFHKLEQVKSESEPKEIDPEQSFWERILSYFAPVSLAGALGTFIILWTTTQQIGQEVSQDWEGRTEVLNNIQGQEVLELSTLSDSEWDNLISAAK